MFLQIYNIIPIPGRKACTTSQILAKTSQSCGCISGFACVADGTESVVRNGRGQKIGLRYFKIQGTYFKICALLFFFSPMRVKSAENQFSIFPFPERRFSVPIFCRAMSVLRCSGAGRECKTKGGTRAGHRLRLVCLSQLCGYCFSKRAAHPPPGCITALSTSFLVTVCVVTL